MRWIGGDGLETKRPLPESPKNLENSVLLVEAEALAEQRVERIAALEIDRSNGHVREHWLDDVPGQLPFLARALSFLSPHAHSAVLGEQPAERSVRVGLYSVGAGARF